MSYLDRLASVRQWSPPAYWPFLVDGVRVGRIAHTLARRLADFPAVFAVDERAVALSDRLTTPDARSEAVHEVGVQLANAGDIRPLRNETYGVSEGWHVPARLRLDRGLVPLFGTRSYGVHLNGYTGTGAAQRLWIGRRAPTKRVAPDKYDHIVAGGVGHGYGLRETLTKEAAEEADIPGDMAAKAQPAGALSYICEAESGLRDDTLFIYDLSLPEDFIPRNTDGELVGFETWHVPDAMTQVRDTDSFKFNVAPVMIDFFIRHGWLDPDRDADYLAICAALHGQNETLI